MFFSKKKKRKRFLLFAYILFFRDKRLFTSPNSNELLLEYYKMFRPVRLARPEDPEALQQHGLNQRSPTEGKGKGQKLPNSTP